MSGVPTKPYPISKPPKPYHIVLMLFPQLLLSRDQRHWVAASKSLEELEGVETILLVESPLLP